MEHAANADRRLPVPVTAFGPLGDFSLRVHELAHTGHCREAIAAADAYFAFATVVGDEKTASFLLQGKMYAYLMAGSPAEALVVGEQLLRRHQLMGFTLGEAKTLSDLAELHVYLGRYVEGMRYLARASLLLDRVPPRGDRYRSAVQSFAEAATGAELYETAAEAYERLLAAEQAVPLTMSTSFDLAYATTLLYWGLRLDHLGRHEEAARRLRRCATLARRWVDHFTDRETACADPGISALLALALAKLGEVVEAEKLAREVIVPLRANESWWHARLAHLALGICLRGQAQFADARREFVAAEQLCTSDSRPDDPLVIRFERALLACETDGGQPSRELFDTVRAQAQELWRLRLQRLAMLRQARQREEIESARAHAEREVMRDALTGLGNRRQFDLLMQAVDAGTLGGRLVLLLIDIDHFKAVNDAFSHSAGDRVLRGLAAILRAHCRAEDVAVRYAGDEFTVFVRADLSAGREVAERIRAAVQAAEILPGIRLTVSTGLAVLAPGMTGDELFRAADERLYEAKRRGRNTVA
jgi:diguanylate cyclase (GGDEF)-like protein